MSVAIIALVAAVVAEHVIRAPARPGDPVVAMRWSPSSWSRGPGGRRARPLDLDVLAALVVIALVAAVVAELDPQHVRYRCAHLDPAPWLWSGGRGPGDIS
jgi:hypothetical protein